ncbi:hypothetical protein MJO28_016572 [Puccinia striiformis f. sp. tritici]|uniref:Uncharacterized protein n=1 Tax=Puccinia striiformis f. sp. tritici TaxID=168172 RepID=A0ACC0DNX8_9BASI|nr:hypothetical protein MJO28_016572 [Puccinia striiformis f. sp. tritici]
MFLSAMSGAADVWTRPSKPTESSVCDEPYLSSKERLGGRPGTLSTRSGPQVDTFRVESPVFIKQGLLWSPAGYVLSFKTAQQSNDRRRTGWKASRQAM